MAKQGANSCILLFSSEIPYRRKKSEMIKQGVFANGNSFSTQIEMHKACLAKRRQRRAKSDCTKVVRSAWRRALLRPVRAG